ncbi:hypothetical protein J2T55_000200 [Methylohalomonas lacus]|uniref:Uncharacterized protein n=1 Tax=Methylohalomonas lacus TaxID=398773 RepID=A0AAE3HJ97_9GAMM|nr:hypothetical protein [Methylohalomonas lacus]MCS3902208.1 hypothetical protein [Methylohalomonas lacus]
MSERPKPYAITEDRKVVWLPMQGHCLIDCTQRPDDAPSSSGSLTADGQYNVRPRRSAAIIPFPRLHKS